MATREEQREARLTLETFLPYRLAMAAEGISRDFAALYGEKYGLSRPEWRTLATIGQFGRTTAREIGAHSSMHKTKVSRAVHALEKRHWLTRTADTTDRRIEHLELTRKGRRCYGDLADIALAYEREIAGRLGDEQIRHLIDGIAAIERTIKKS